MRRMFWGGVHPPGHKELTAGMPPRPLPAPSRVVLPMLQHLGDACMPLVEPGARVKAGEKVGDGEGMCVPVHSPISGVVSAVEPRPHSSGREVMAVVIDNDFRDAPAPPMPPLQSPSGEELAERLREAGIVGMGGAAFPSGQKLRTALDGVDTLLANGCECEGYLTADDALMRAWPEQVIRGLEILREVLRPQRTVLAVEDNKPEAIAALKGALAGRGDIEVSILPTRYPQGAEKQLIQAVTGRQVPAGQIPSGVGCLVFNVATLAAIGQAVDEGTPLMERIVTVTGEGASQPQNWIVPIGTLFRDVLAASDGLTGEEGQVISGGPMMGVAQERLDVPVLKGTGAILCQKRVLTIPDKPVCIRCGKCVAVCPVHLQPLYLYRYAGLEDGKELRRLRLEDCIGCGCCSYVCPGQLPLVERFRQTKKKAKEGKAS